MNQTTAPSRRLGRIGAWIGFGALCAAAAGLGTLTMRGRGNPSRRWYRSLRKSRLQPPGAVFGPVWSVLYATIAYSGYRIWSAERSPARTRALAMWGAQLALNAAWTPLFFGARKPVIALADIIALDAHLLAYTVLAKKVDTKAAAAVVPYLGWTAFATYLNGAIVAKN
jgi:tryptophan-rich sensory protein